MLFHVLLPMFGTFLCTAPSILRARIRGQAKRMAPEHHEVVIIGGGTGGLFTAKKLLGAGVDDVIVLESRPVVGGRVSTTRDDAGNPMFNNFAWRVSEENTMMRALAEELGLNLILQTTPPPNDAAKGHSEGKHGGLSPMRDESNATEREIAPKRAPLSDFARASLNSASAADMQDRESGYAGRTSQISWTKESSGTDFWFVEGGMDMYPNELAKWLPEGCIRTNHRASEVERVESGYRVTVWKRYDGGGYTCIEFTCCQVVLATPPYSLRHLKVAKDMLPALFAVHERRLGHVYAKCAPNTLNVPDRSNVPDRIYRLLPDSILQQIISGDYGSGSFQAAYACDRFERVWRELQYQGPESVKEEVKKQLNKITDLLAHTPPNGWDAIDEVYVRIGFVHRWHIEAHVAGKTKEELSMQAITPNPARLPGLYLVGEAFSPHQGWTEGALWTAEKAASIIAKARQSPGVYEYADGDRSKFAAKIMAMEKGNEQDSKLPSAMVYKGLVLDVADWYQRHPGGAGPIHNHADEDISHIFDTFHPGWPAPLATLFGLQIGCTDETVIDD